MLSKCGEGPRVFPKCWGTHGLRPYWPLDSSCFRAPTCLFCCWTCSLLPGVTDKVERGRRKVGLRIKVSHGLDLAKSPGFSYSVPISGLCQGRSSAAQEDGRGQMLLRAAAHPNRTSFLVNIHHQERDFLSPFSFSVSRRSQFTY